jgi:hypothetical protein
MRSGFSVALPEAVKEADTLSHEPFRLENALRSGPKPDMGTGPRTGDGVPRRGQREQLSEF